MTEMRQNVPIRVNSSVEFSRTHPDPKGILNSRGKLCYRIFRKGEKSSLGIAPTSSATFFFLLP